MFEKVIVILELSLGIVLDKQYLVWTKVRPGTALRMQQ